MTTAIGSSTGGYKLYGGASPDASPQLPPIWQPFVSGVASTINQFINPQQLANWQIQSIEKIKSLRNLPADWSSYGEPAPASSVCDWAQSFILEIQYANLQTPQISPESGGGIQIDWWSGLRRELEFHIEPNQPISFLQLENGESVAEGSFSRFDKPKAYELISWLRHG